MNFITSENFEKHVKETINIYCNAMSSFDLKRFNKNIVDPIKIIFDKGVSGKTYQEIINEEIRRQKDKTDNNAIGYFHQNIFKYFEGCVVPDKGWDVIFQKDDKTYYVEMKNKHNTMNDASSRDTFKKMIEKTKADKKAICCLVEIIASDSQNIVWKKKIGEEKIDNERIRRISIDKFYEIVTGDKNAFYEVCKQLPITLNKLMKDKEVKKAEDTVYNELQEMNDNIEDSLFSLAFNQYEGFKKPAA